MNVLCKRSHSLVMALLLAFATIILPGCKETVSTPTFTPVSNSADVIRNLGAAGFEVQVSLEDPSPGPYAARYAARYRDGYSQINADNTIEASFWEKEDARLMEIEALADSMQATAKQLSVSGKMVDILEYKDEASAVADIEYIKLFDVTTFSIQAPTEKGPMGYIVNSMRAGPTDYYRVNNIIALYVERPIIDQPINNTLNAKIKTALEAMFGPPFYTV